MFLYFLHLSRPLSASFLSEYYKGFVYYIVLSISKSIIVIVFFDAQIVPDLNEETSSNLLLCLLTTPLTFTSLFSGTAKYPSILCIFPAQDLVKISYFSMGCSFHLVSNSILKQDLALGALISIVSFSGWKRNY